MPDEIPIVGRFFAPGQALRDYLTSLSLTAWKPEFVVLHNTGSPTLDMRPNGFDLQKMHNLAHYYAGLDWHAGPHFFVDQNGIWVFSNPSKPGVHSPSWNDISWGVEMLGDYDRDDFDSGDGAKVAANAVFLLAALSKKAGLDSGTLRLHKWDPLTTHKQCPGDSVVWSSVVARVHALLESWKLADKYQNGDHRVPHTGLTGEKAA